MLCYICLLSNGKWAIYTIAYINLRYFIWSDLKMQCYSFQHPIKVFILIIIVLTCLVFGMWTIWMCQEGTHNCSFASTKYTSYYPNMQTEDSHKFRVVQGKQGSTLKYVLRLFHKMWTLPIHSTTYALLSVCIFKKLSTINSIYNVSASSSLPHQFNK